MRPFIARLADHLRELSVGRIPESELADLIEYLGTEALVRRGACLLGGEAQRLLRDAGRAVGLDLYAPPVIFTPPRLLALGGAESRDGAFQTASCRVQAAGPGRACLACGGAYDQAAIGEEMAGLVVPHYGNDPAGLGGEPSVIPLNMVAAGYEVMRFMEIVLAVSGQVQLRRQRFDFREGDTATHDAECTTDCPRVAAEGTGDFASLPVGIDPRFNKPDVSKHLAR